MASLQAARVSTAGGVAQALDPQVLTHRYARFVRGIAGKVKRKVAREIEFDDLVEYGMLGLLEAAARFDASQGASFMTFAYYRVRGAIYDGLRGMGWMTRHEYAKARFEERAQRFLADSAEAEAKGGPVPAPPSEATRAELEAAVQGLAAVYLTTLDAAEARRLPANDEDADVSMAMAQARTLVREAMARLPEQERQLLELYYYEDLSLQEVGAALGLSKSWTCRLHGRVIGRLQRMLAGSLAPDGDRP